MGPALPCNVTSQGLALPLVTSPIVSGGQSKVGTAQGTPKLGRPEAVSFAGFSGDRDIQGEPPALLPRALLERDLRNTHPLGHFLCLLDLPPPQSGLDQDKNDGFQSSIKSYISLTDNWSLSFAACHILARTKIQCQDPKS